ncbi:hypothetical protein DFH07DRAFT_926049 [Mycena maculata]|uniref:Uncharacterized protein n=1 Tax=Mycena maculata TaxID=230809 RepID=A0AAD7IEX8_9AGAR|nr:hypothetical protein DFH07DRAFT_926049 [Mycena maculata]
MYSDPRLDTPPPQSQFRRPWSPDPYDPLPSTQHSYFPDNQYPATGPDFQPDYGYDYAPRRREPSDVSVEALDLADYAMTLRAHQANPYQGQYGQDMYPPSPPAHRPLANRPPSVVSRMDTLSSNTHTTSSRGRRPPRRPFSLPPPSVQSHSSRKSHPTSPRSANSHNHPYPSLKQGPRSSQPDIDTAHFPAWSRNWYNNKPKPVMAANDIYTALPNSSWNSKRSPFDPGNTFPADSFPDPYDQPSSSLVYDSSRDVLPWSSEPTEYGPMIDSAIKEERMRMLEREFGPNAKGKGPATSNGDFLDENCKPLVGTVDAKGQLVTKGPRSRMALRVIQILLSLAAAIPSIYAALVIKPTTGTPPPSGTVAAYILYVFSVLSLLLLLYLFAFRPCCCPGKRRKAAGSGGNPLSNGMMVLPVSGLPGSKKNKAKAKKGKNGMPGDVQVNLIVDPNAFGAGRQDEDDDTSEDDNETGSVPGSFDPVSARRKRKRAKRRSVFAGLAMEEDWKRARSWTKKITAVDVLGIILWGATFIFILIGKRCPSGSYDGWCNAYNVSSAAACLLCVSFIMGVFFDVQDLHASKASPRTRV